MRIVITLALSLMLSACAFTGPAVPVPKAPLADGDHVDAGMIGVIDGHEHVRQFYVTRYAWLVKTYGARIVPPVTDPDRGFTKNDGGDFTVTKEVLDNFQRLDRFSKVAP